MATPRPELAEAVWTLLEADPARMLALASSLRAPDRSIESTVAGVSMGRALPPGSRIRIELSGVRYDVGDVVAFLAGSQVVVHRMVYRGRLGAARGHVLTRGDSVLVPDPPLPHVNVLGPVTAVRRNDEWTEPGGAHRRSWPQRATAQLVLWAAVVAMSVSPRVASAGLSLLKRGERALRFAVARGSGRRAPASRLQ